MEKEKFNKEAEKLYKSIENKYGLTVYGSRNHTNKKFVFIRGRLADSKNLTPKENRFSYPPPKFCTSFGRANYPCHPVMYCANSAELIAMELSFKKDDWFHLAVFHTPSPVEHFQYILLLNENISENNIWSKILTEYKEHVKKSLPADHKENGDEVWHRVQQAAIAFQNDDYSETAAISHNWIYKNGLDAILYSSAKTNKYCNFALNPNFVDHNLKLYKVHLCRWRETDFNLFKTGVENNNKIDWHLTSKEDFDEYQKGYSFLE